MTLLMQSSAGVESTASVVKLRHSHTEAGLLEDFSYVVVALGSVVGLDWCPVLFFIYIAIFARAQSFNFEPVVVVRMRNLFFCYLDDALHEILLRDRVSAAHNLLQNTRQHGLKIQIKPPK